MQSTSRNLRPGLHLTRLIPHGVPLPRLPPTQPQLLGQRRPLRTTSPAFQTANTSDEYAKTPQSLQTIRVEPELSRRKTHFRDLRVEVKHHPDTAADLVAYENGDDNHKYSVLRRLIPEALIGKPSPLGLPWRKSDTFFTDYKEHHGTDNILSETDHSLIIGNAESHDCRQYSKECDPEGQDKRASAGMSYLHFLAIPKRKVYNAIALDSTDVVDELVVHFRRFWCSRPVETSIKRIEAVMKARSEKVLQSFEVALKQAPTDAELARKAENAKVVMKQVEQSAHEFARQLRELHRRTHPDNIHDFFLFGLHLLPVASGGHSQDASVGHLHMHILLSSPEFRRYSTAAHDEKTIPVEAVREVILEEERAVKRKEAMEEKATEGKAKNRRKRGTARAGRVGGV